MIGAQFAHAVLPLPWNVVECDMLNIWPFVEMHQNMFQVSEHWAWDGVKLTKGTATYKKDNMLAQLPYFWTMRSVCKFKEQKTLPFSFLQENVHMSKAFPDMYHDSFTMDSQSQDSEVQVTTNKRKPNQSPSPKITYTRSGSLP